MTNKRDREVLREWTRGQEPSEWELKLCWINEKTGNRITPGQVIRDSRVKHRVKRELVRWLKEYGNQKLEQEKKIVNGKQVKDLWKMESQGLANHGWTREEGGGG